MPARFFDTSALVKYYVDETGSEWVTDLITQADAGNYIAYVTGVEMTAALTRRNLPASLKRFEADFAQGYRRLALPEATITTARNLARQHKLRGYDAIQLASALALAEALGQKQVEFVCADTERVAAARKHKLNTSNPIDQMDRDGFMNKATMVNGK